MGRTPTPALRSGYGRRGWASWSLRPMAWPGHRGPPRLTPREGAYCRPKGAARSPCAPTLESPCPPPRTPPCRPAPADSPAHLGRPARLPPEPQVIVEHLDRHVVGQQAAKRKLAVAVSNHFKRLADGERSTGRVTGPDPLADAPDLIHVPIERSNVLLIGPSGSGKTLLVQVLAKNLNVPVVIGDATTFTEAGYVGDDVESLLTRLFLAAGGDFGRPSGASFSSTRSTSCGSISATRGCQGRHGRGRPARPPEDVRVLGHFIPTKLGPRHPEAETVPFDTTDVLFICGGAFPGLEDIIARRLGRDAGRFGFGAATDRPEVEGDLLRHVLPCDLEAFGMIPELLGRLPVIATLDDLGEDDLVRILSDPENALLKQYRKLLRLQGADLDFTPDAIKEIARLAYERGTGAGACGRSSSRSWRTSCSRSARRTGARSS